MDDKQLRATCLVLALHQHTATKLDLNTEEIVQSAARFYAFVADEPQPRKDESDVPF